MKNKISRHCKIYKTPASLHYHLKQEHSEFVSVDLNYDDVVEEMNEKVKGRIGLWDDLSN